MSQIEEFADRRQRFLDSVGTSLNIIHGRPNIRYLTGYDGGGFPPWLVLDDGRMTLVHYTAEEDSVVRLAESMDLVPFGPADDEITVVSDVLLQRGRSPAAGDLSWWSPSDFRAVESIEHGLVDCGDQLAALRAVKTNWEQGKLRASGEITSATMQRLVDMASHHATSRELAIALYEKAITLGSGPLPPVPFVAVGRASFENHATWDASDEPAGPFLLEFATSVDGYGVPLSRSGTHIRRGQKALDGIRRGIDRALERLQPDEEARTIDGLLRSSIAESGFELRHRAGYSIGLGESDTWMEGRVARLAPHATFRLKPGMAFHIVGSVVMPGEFGVAHSVSALVTPDGHEVLAG